ncbi:6627_t:CDS:10 [Gigaspora margarita]|uniref:6627_t:CDS:1 n=1 Tax=Gigaspora margarita TaxID=4874 RepID=A0ABN7V288_GIGMA|nr:6627_t:CDS:10 [Gigaspora margarita]
MNVLEKETERGEEETEEKLPSSVCSECRQKKQFFIEERQKHSERVTKEKEGGCYQCGDKQVKTIEFLERRYCSDCWKWQTEGMKSGINSIHRYSQQRCRCQDDGFLQRFEEIIVELKETENFEHRRITEVNQDICQKETDEKIRRRRAGECYFLCGKNLRKEPKQLVEEKLSTRRLERVIIFLAEKGVPFPSCQKCGSEVGVDEWECPNHIFFNCFKCDWDGFVLVKPQKEQEFPAACTEDYCFNHCPSLAKYFYEKGIDDNAIIQSGGPVIEGLFYAMKEHREKYGDYQKLFTSIPYLTDEKITIEKTKTKPWELARRNLTNWLESRKIELADIVNFVHFTDALFAADTHPFLVKFLQTLKSAHCKRLKDYDCRRLGEYIGLTVREIDNLENESGVYQIALGEAEKFRAYGIVRNKETLFDFLLLDPNHLFSRSKGENKSQYPYGAGVICLRRKENCSRLSLEPKDKNLIK